MVRLRLDTNQPVQYHPKAGGKKDRLHHLNFIQRTGLASLPVQSQELARFLKFQIKEVERLYYLGMLVSCLICAFVSHMQKTGFLMVQQR